MRANRARDTGPELRLRQALRAAHLGGLSGQLAEGAGATQHRVSRSTGSRSSCTAATGITAHGVIRTFRSPIPTSGHASSSSIASGMPASAATLSRRGWFVSRSSWECDIRDRSVRCAHTVRARAVLSDDPFDVGVVQPERLSATSTRRARDVRVPRTSRAFGPNVDELRLATSAAIGGHGQQR